MCDIIFGTDSCFSCANPDDRCDRYPTLMQWSFHITKFCGQRKKDSTLEIRWIHLNWSDFQKYSVEQNILSMKVSLYNIMRIDIELIRMWHSIKIGKPTQPSTTETIVDRKTIAYFFTRLFWMSVSLSPLYQKLLYNWNVDLKAYLRLMKNRNAVTM